jgi:pullulanase
MQLVKAFFDDYDLLRVKVDKRHYQGKINEFFIIDQNNKYIKTKLINTEDHKAYVIYELKFEYDLLIGSKYYLITNNYAKTIIDYRFIVKTKKFNREFFYNSDLGSIVIDNKTTFRLWAPTAANVYLKLYENDTFKIIKLNRTNRGVFEIEIPDNLDGRSYNYLVEQVGVTNEVVDPYAKAKTPNTLRSIVVDFNKLKYSKVSLDKKVSKLNNMFIYELSVADYTSAKYGFKHPHKFAGLVEAGVTDKKGNPIGLDHLKNLGVSHVQILPILDFATKDELNPDKFYNWGYDPLTYFSVEGSYVEDIYNHQAQIQEVRAMVNGFHDAGIRVVLDVVYNHVYDIELVVFDKIIPYYFYRFNQDFTYSQGSMFVDIDTKQTMVQKFLVDNIKYLVKEFDVDGFRFDLMGIIDCDTIEKMYYEARQIKDDIILYGEGWSNNTNLLHQEKCTIENDSKHAYISFFNDYFRDNIVGQSWSGSDMKGYALGDVTKLTYAIDVLKGKHANHFITPWQSLNFIECHDGYTLADKVVKETGSLNKDLAAMAMAMLILSQGILFMHQGQEFLKSKNMLDNTYNDNSGLNLIEWKKLDQEKDYFELIKKLLKFRKENSDLFFDSLDEIESKVKIFPYFGAIIYEVNGNSRYRYIFNNSGRDLDISKFKYSKVIVTNGDLDSLNNEDLMLNNTFAIFKI